VTASLRKKLAHLSRHYGMAGVLVLLCAYYSAATLREQQPRGEAAADRLAGQLTGTSRVLIVAQETEEDARFIARLDALLAGRVAGKIAGDPRAARQALKQLSDSGQPLDVIATTPDCAAWTVFENLREKFPALGDPRVVFASSYRWPTFLNRDNLLNIANQTAVVAILAAGMTLVILAGGIDLSVGSLIALSAVVGALFIRDYGGGTNAGTGALILCSLAGIGACAVVGAFSGWVITMFRIPAFIATLAMMQVASGLAFIFSKGATIYEVPDSFTWLGRGTGWLGLPHAVVLMGAIYAALHIFMAKTPLGRHIYAVGGNAEAAWLSGIRVDRVRRFVYTLCGALAGLGGVILASQLKSATPTYGGSYELYVIASVVVGGTSLSGGQGRVLGTLIGAFIIAVIQNGMNLTGVESYTQKVVLGLVILGAVLLDILKNRGWRGLMAPHP
jgi:ribose transport system permease protein